MTTSIIDDITPVWHQRPALFRGPSWARWATPALVHEGLSKAAASEGTTWRLFEGETMVRRHDPEVLPRATESALASYLARLTRDHDAPGLIVNQFQAASHGCWEAVAPLVSALYTAFGSSHGGALVDLFLTGRCESFFGAHKDDQDVFMFVASGCKRVELWAYDSLRTSHGAPGYYTPKHMGQVEIERAPDLVLDAHAGDVVYWPAGYWHRIHNLDDLTAGLSLGLFTRPDPLALLARLSQIDVAASTRHLQNSAARRSLEPRRRVGSELDAMLSGLGSEPRSRAQLCEAMLSFKSRLGFRSSPRIARPTSARGRQVRVTAPGVIEVLKTEGELVVGIAGDLARYPADTGLEAALERLAGGEAIGFDALERLVLDHDPSWAEFSVDQRRGLLDKLVCDLAEVCALVDCGPDWAEIHACA